MKNTIKIANLPLLLLSLLTPHLAGAVMTKLGSPDLNPAAAQYRDLLATPTLLLEPGMTKADLDTPNKVRDMIPKAFRQSKDQSILDYKHNANFSVGQTEPLKNLRPKLFVSVKKNDPEPCDETGRRAKEKNPLLVFATMRLFDENGDELVYPEINEHSSYTQYQSMDGNFIFDYQAQYIDELGESHSWSYSDKREKNKDNGNFLVKAPQYKESRSCIYISTGDFGSTDTPTGYFRPVNGRLYPSGEGDTTYVSRSYGDPMPWAVFYYNGFALHATGINNYQHIGGPASHGCLRQSVQDSHWLFNQIRKTWSTEPIALISKDGEILAEKKKGYDTIISVQGDLSNKNYFRSTEISTPIPK